VHSDGRQSGEQAEASHGGRWKRREALRQKGVICSDERGCSRAEVATHIACVMIELAAGQNETCADQSEQGSGKVVQPETIVGRPHG